MVSMYTNNRLFEIAKDNYIMLVRYCHTLVDEGYWEQPKLILRQSIYGMLDLYIQAVLVQLAIDGNRFGGDERRFIRLIVSENQLAIDEEMEITEELVTKVRRMQNTPPILLQLCSLRDMEKKTRMIHSLFDSLLNVMIAMFHLNSEKDQKANQLIEEFYDKAANFLNIRREDSFQLDKEYIQKKLRENDFEKVSKLLKLCQEDALDILEDGALIGGKIHISAPSIKTAKEYHYTMDPSEAVYEESQPEKVSPDIQKDIPLPEAEPAVKETPQAEQGLEYFLEELNSLIGLDGVKEEMNSLINLIKIRNMRAGFAMPQLDMSYHMVFTGNPGTGKTTVARLVARIYKELGLLSKGTLLETDRSGLVAGYVGQTALKVKEVVEKAIGGVLFIDEAYSLTNSGASNDFGTEAVDTLVKLMEDNRDDLVVIVAGYKNEMKSFLRSNTGLVSRFNKFIEFSDYSIDELIDILNSLAKKAGITLTAEASLAVKEQIEAFNREEKRSFGNGRGIRNMFEKLLVAQANRLVKLSNPTMEQLGELIRDDVIACQK